MARLITSMALAATAVSAAATDNCSSPLVNLIEQVFHANSTFDLAHNLLAALQGKCASGGCPTVTLPGCSAQSIDDVECKLPSIADVTTDIGGDTICDAGCDSWPCKVSCDGIDVGICYGADYILCKGGCLGIPSCVRKCEHAIVDPCKAKLIDGCKTKCDGAFNDCKAKCQKELALEVILDFLYLQHGIASLAVQGLSTACAGDGIVKPLAFNTSVAVGVGDVAVGLGVNIKMAGLTFKNLLFLNHVQMTVGMPITGAIQCNPIGTQSITATAGSTTVSGFNLDVDLKLDSALHDIAAAICVDLPVCKDAIQSAIQSTIKSEIVSLVPSKVAGILAAAINAALTKATCPKISSEAPASENLIIA